MTGITYKLEELAQTADVSPRTVRYYVQRGLLPAPEFRGRDTVYSAVHLLRLKAIKTLQARFFHLDAIAAELEGRSEAEVRRLAEGKFADRAKASPLPPVNQDKSAPRLPPQPAPGLVGACPAMLDIFRMLPKLASSDSCVLITGGPGSGKEALAREIHRRSHRAERPFLVVECSAIPEQLLECELFGHVRGSFTGQITSRTGLLQQADGGTVLLNAVSELPLAMQAKLMRMMHDGNVRPVGSEGALKVDARLMGTTSSDLAAAVGASGFREDFYQRMSVLQVALPPLCERGDDVLLLAEAAFARLATERPTAAQGFAPDTIGAIRNHTWGGNVRELELRIERAMALCEGPLISADDLGLAPVTRKPGAYKESGGSLPPGASGWKRWELAPGLELHLANDASEDVALLARNLSAEAARGRR